MSITNIEVDKVCRTCLIPSEVMKSLYEACSSAMQMCVAELLSKCASLKIPVANDELPTQICQDCLCELNQAYKFVLKCRKSDDKLRNHLNKNINTSAVVQISRRNYGITQTDEICINTEEAININTIQNTSDLNANVNLEADLTLGISDLSMKQENVETLEDGRCSGDNFKSSSLNDSFECFNDFNISLREPLPTSAIQTNLDQELDVIKHEIDCDVKTEMQRYINYRNEEFDVNRAAVNLHENATEPEPCRQSSKRLPEKETKNKIISVHTKAKNALSSVNLIEFKKSHNMNSVHTDEIISNQPENTMNMKNAVVSLNNINVHLKSLRSPIPHQFEQLNIAASKSINKIAIIADTTSTRHKIGQIHRDRQTSNINDQYCTKMSVKPVSSYRVKPKSKCQAINMTEETFKPATSHLRGHQVHIPYTCKFTCTVCEKSFNNKRGLRRHTMTHTKESLYPPDGIVKPITRTCDKTFTQRGDVTTHMVTHTGERPYSCSTCHKTFTQRGHLTRHMFTHTGERPYSCATCDKTFTLRRLLTRHMLIHTGEKPYSCAICDKTFPRKEEMTRHMMIHTGEKPYSCPTCEKTFTHRRQLTTHKLIHTGEKPYSCATCDKTFNVRANLSRHMLIHTGKKPYSCATCDKAFTRKGEVTTHMFTHTGERPYSCATCDKTYTRIEHLTRHMLIHIGKKHTKENM